MTTTQHAIVKNGKVEIATPHLSEGETVSVTLETLTQNFSTRRKRTVVPLDDYLSRITPENTHAPIESGGTQGKELL